jgi:hypothetical protein
MQTHKFGGCGWCGNLNFRNTFMFFFCMGQKRRHFWIMFIEWKKKTLLDYVYRVEKEDTSICHGAKKEEYPLNLSFLIFSQTLSKKSFSFTIATPCTMHLGGVSCSVNSSTINLVFPQSPRRKIPCNGFSQQQACRDLRSLHGTS